jgi:uncharacterized protein (TIGR02145 family)
MKLKRVSIVCLSGTYVKPKYGMINFLMSLLLLGSLSYPGPTIMPKSVGTFTDSQDGQTYKTVSFKEDSTGKIVTWMAQNLNYKVEGSYAYDDNESNRKELGLLYTWEAAKKACPSGWHLPTDNEWAILVTQFGGMDKAGEALKSIKSWNEDCNGTNSSGFDALAGGIRRPDGSYMFQGTLGYFWTSTLINSVDKAWEWNFHYGGSQSSNKKI